MIVFDTSHFFLQKSRIIQGHPLILSCTNRCITLYSSSLTQKNALKFHNFLRIDKLN